MPRHPRFTRDQAINDLHGWEDEMANISLNSKASIGQQQHAPRWSSCTTAEIENRNTKVVSNPPFRGDGASRAMNINLCRRSWCSSTNYDFSCTRAIRCKGAELGIPSNANRCSFQPPQAMGAAVVLRCSLLDTPARTKERRNSTPTTSGKRPIANSCIP